MNVGAIRTAIRARGYETDTAAAQLEAINSIDRRIQGMRRWPWNERTTSTALAEGGNQLPYPTDAREIDSVQIEYADVYPTLEYRPYNEINEWTHRDREVGLPQYWTERGGTIYVYPATQYALTVTIDYARETVTLDDDGDEPTIPPDYHDLYVVGALHVISARERDWSSYAVFKQEFDERLMEMIRAVGVRQRQNSRQVVRSSFWDSIQSYG